MKTTIRIALSVALLFTPLVSHAVVQSAPLPPLFSAAHQTIDSSDVSNDSLKDTYVIQEKAPTELKIAQAPVPAK